MYPAYLIRTGIDWVRHNEEFKDSNPYSRCEEAINVCQQLWAEQYGGTDAHLVEPGTVTAYWAEFFHASDPLPDEHEWRDGLIKRSNKFDNFDEWQESFKQAYASVYKEDIIWLGVLTAAWAHTHQFEVIYSDEAWEFRPAVSYLPTSEVWRLEPHMETVAEILRELWIEEIHAYEEIDFHIEEAVIPYLGRAECLGFDTRQVMAVWPARAKRDKTPIDLGEMVSDIVLPPGDNWYRTLDHLIFAHDFLDVTALMTRARYVFGSRRRLLELLVDSTPEQAQMQASAEGWLVSEVEIAHV